MEEGRDSFIKRSLKIARGALVICMILAPCLYAVKLRLSLREAGETADSLRRELSWSYLKIDSLKQIQDTEVLNRDYLEDLVDRKLGDRASEVMIVIDTTLEASTARKAIEDKMNLEAWVDSIRAPFPEGVSAHVKLHYLQSRAVRLERLNHYFSNRFGD